LFKINVLWTSDNKTFEKAITSQLESKLPEHKFKLDQSGSISYK